MCTDQYTLGSYLGDPRGHPPRAGHRRRPSRPSLVDDVDVGRDVNSRHSLCVSSSESEEGDSSQSAIPLPMKRRDSLLAKQSCHPSRSTEKPISVCERSQSQDCPTHMDDTAYGSSVTSQGSLPGISWSASLDLEAAFSYGSSGRVGHGFSHNPLFIVDEECLTLSPQGEKLLLHTESNSTQDDSGSSARGFGEVLSPNTPFSRAKSHKHSGVSASHGNQKPKPSWSDVYDVRSVSEEAWEPPTVRERHFSEEWV